MTQKEQRQLALGAVRSYLRGMGIDPIMVTAADAYVCLDELARIEPETLASNWYRQASDQHYRCFLAEWGRWQQHQHTMMSYVYEGGGQ